MSQISKSEIDSLRKDTYQYERSVLRLEISDLAPISAILEYKVDAHYHESIRLIFYTNRMKKKLFKRDPVYDTFIAKEYHVSLSSSKDWISKIIKSCDLTLDDSFKHTDGTYHSILAKEYDSNEIQICTIVLLADEIENRDEIGSAILKILKEINYEKKEEDFKEMLKPGFYYNYGSHYLKKKYFLEH